MPLTLLSSNNKLKITFPYLFYLFLFNNLSFNDSYLFNLTLSIFSILFSNLFNLMHDYDNNHALPSLCDAVCSETHMVDACITHADVPHPPPQPHPQPTISVTARRVTRHDGLVITDGEDCLLVDSGCDQTIVASNSFKVGLHTGIY